jgi:hypothetical protein
MFNVFLQQHRTTLMRKALLAGVAMATLPAQAVTTATPPTTSVASKFKGEFQGTGRACYGELKIMPKKFSWNTSFSACSSRSFQVTELEPLQGRKRLLYRLSGVQKNCRYRTVVLSYPDPAVPAAAWDVTGYRSERDYQDASVEHSISCAVVQTR